MTDKLKDKLVLFGAGKIGRSFIGQLFSQGDYEVVFIDIDNKIIDELNRRNSYNIIQCRLVDESSERLDFIDI